MGFGNMSGLSRPIRCPPNKPIDSCVSCSLLTIITNHSRGVRVFGDFGDILGHSGMSWKLKFLDDSDRFVMDCSIV